MTRMERYHQTTATPEETPAQNPLPPKKTPPRKKGKKAKRIFGLLLIGVLVLVILGIFSYRKGIKTAENDPDFASIAVTEFHGKKAADGSINVLLLGSDSRGEDRGRSDSILVANYHPKRKTPKLLSFMRDTYVNIPTVGYNKINAAYSYGGPELVRQTIAQNFGIEIPYYAVVSFASFPKIIDSLCPKGLQIDAEKDLDLDGVFIKKGKQAMDGHTALQYARFRKDEEGDFGRVRRQQQVMNALLKQGLSVKNSFHLPKTVGQVQGYTTTNIPASFYVRIGKDFLFGRAKPLEKLTIPVDGSWENGYYDDAGSVLEINEETNRTAVQNFLQK